MECDLVGVGKINFDVVDSPEGRATYVGGHVPNIISSVARLGLRTALIARVGNDPEGEQCLTELKRRGVDVSHVTVDEDPTPVCRIKVVDGDRILDPRPARMTEYHHRDIDLIENGRAAFVGRDTINFEAYAAACDEFGILRTGSLQFVRDPDGKGVEKLSVYPPNVLFANEEERGIGGRAAEAVLANEGSVVTTLGPNGCTVESSGSRRTYPAFSARVVDATGAGDAFTAGYLFGILSGLGERRSAIMANAMGALAVMEKGPVPSVSRYAVEKFIGERQRE